MLPDLKEIKLKRVHAALTQTELSRLAGISQSLIAKIESAKVVPSYANAKRIFDTLDGLRQKSSVKASGMMTKKVISIRPDATLKEAAGTMKKFAVSQLPVIDNGKLVGTVTENDIITKLHEGAGKIDSTKLKAEDVMEEPLPVIHENSTQELISSLLDHYPAILVGSKGKFLGIISKTDMLNVVLKK